MNQLYLPLRKNISMLGKLLGDTIKEALSEEVLNRVELIRKLSKKAHNNGDKQAHEQLLNEINKMTDEELLPIARAFNQFLNLTNTADQYHGISPHGEAMNNPNIIKTTIEKISSQHKDKESILKAVQRLSIELVLTAHPTEVNRRTVINNSVAMTNCLAQLDHDDLAEYERNTIMRRLRQLTAQVWYTDDTRRRRPTPIDEARWGFTVVEDSLWEGVPSFLRELNDQLEQTLGYELPIDATPIQFTSWMGGDRDGNPNVTAKITEYVISLARLKAVELFLKDIQVLVNELSMTTCTSEFNELLKNSDVQEPYREVLKQLRSQLSKTKRYLTLKIEGQDALPEPDLIVNNQQLWQPLYACYQSLKACGMKLIANGPLLDTLRRVKCFGIQLVRLDIRQDSSRHVQALSELTQFLDLGDYAQWDEKQKQAFLISELTSKRPLIPYNWQPTTETQEVLDTCQVIANCPDDTIASYVISMSKAPSDVLAVNLLLKSVGCRKIIPIVPLFETLDDLNHANSVMQALLKIDWYRQHIQNKQIVMIGYSDSAKDAGTLAASWAQYTAQEELVKTFEKAGIDLTLFHGRGGTIGRGGAPAHAALLSQPPGSLQGGLRVTEQGEMIRFKLGLPQLAVSSLTIYTAAILEANLLAPPEPKQQWRELMDTMSDVSCRAYCQVVKENPDFVNYFRSATPEQEVSRLPLGSRPAKRRVDGGVESLRAIPWIFAWTQNRLALPAWLGAGEALQYAIDQGYEPQLREMQKSWPFFNTRLAMLEMVFKKADGMISAYYEERLVEKQYHYLGQALREQLAKDINVILSMAHEHQPQNSESLMADLPWVAESVNLRNAYTAPLNYLQVELLARSRNSSNPNPVIEQALMTTISGIAAGMRNSG